MRVFALGTGRCCSMTFSKACEHFYDYTSGHETKAGSFNDLNYIDNHIESDAHLFWRLPRLISLYPNALYVHLIREKRSCVKSLAKRKSIDKYASFTEMCDSFDRIEICDNFYDFVNDTIEVYCKSLAVQYIKLWVPPTKELWFEFYTRINSVGNFENSWSEWARRYNAS